MRLDSSTVRRGPRSLPVRLVREEIGVVDFGILLEVKDGIAESFGIREIREEELASQAFFASEHVTMGKTMGSVVAGHAVPFSIMLGEEQDGKGSHPASESISANEQLKIPQRRDPFFLRHGQAVADRGLLIADLAGVGEVRIGTILSASSGRTVAGVRSANFLARPRPMAAR